MATQTKNPRKNADDAYEEFMSMPDDEWNGLVMSLVSGGVLEVEENKGFERAFAERAKQPKTNAMITEQAAKTTLIKPQVIYHKELIVQHTVGVMDMKVNGIDDKAGLDVVYRKRLELSKIKAAVEKEREAEKKYWLEGGRNVDADAKEKQAILAGPLEHLIAQETAVANEKARIAKIKEDEKKDSRLKRLESIGWTEELMVVQDAYLRTTPESEWETFVAQMVTRVADKKLADEARAEQQRKEREESERLRLQKEELDKREQQQKAEAARLQKIQDDIAEQQRKQEQAEKDRLAAIEREEQRKRDEAAEKFRQQEQAEQLRRAKEEAAEKARIETENRIKREADEKAKREKAEQEEAARQAALRPDKEKLMTIATALQSVIFPEVSAEMSDKVSRIEKVLVKAAREIREIINEK